MSAEPVATPDAATLALELAGLTEARRAAWSALTDAEREWVCETGSVRPMPGGASADVQRYLEVGEGARAVMASLHAQEARKARRALTALDEWLLRRS
jgi:hypothetical protein